MSETFNTSKVQQQRVILLLAYFGAAFSGSQRQENAFTVQEALEQALNKLHIPFSSLMLAGRTDAGVHARGQVAQFTMPSGGLQNVPCLVSALNSVLPESISVKEMALTDDTEFHVIKHAQWRWYRYRIFNSPHRSVWMDRDAVWIRQPLDVAAMAAAAQHLVGTQDFKSFQCPHTEITHTICNVVQSQMSREGEYICFDIVANRFIYKMVRNIMGVLIEIGLQNGRTSEDIPVILSKRDRQAAGVTAKPEGLSLMAVAYPKPWDFFQNDVYVTTLDHRVQESSCHEKNILRKAS